MILTPINTTNDNLSVCRHYSLHKVTQHILVCRVMFSKKDESATAALNKPEECRASAGKQLTFKPLEQAYADLLCG